MFTSTAVKESQLCLYQNKVIGIVYVFFTLIVFRHFVCLHHRHCPRITNLVLTQFFSGAESKQAIPSGWYGPILPVSHRIAHERYKRYNNNTNHYARISVGSYLQKKQKNHPTVGGGGGDHRHTRVHTPA